MGAQLRQEGVRNTGGKLLVACPCTMVPGGLHARPRNRENRWARSAESRPAPRRESAPRVTPYSILKLIRQLLHLLVERRVGDAQRLGGQAAVAVGYKSNHFGRGRHALLIRSSWGSQWGDNGYGRLPCAYVQNQLARDFWTFVSEDWLDPDEFSRPTVIGSAEMRRS